MQQIMRNVFITQQITRGEYASLSLERLHAIGLGLEGQRLLPSASKSVLIGRAGNRQD